MPDAMAKSRPQAPTMIRFRLGERVNPRFNPLMTLLYDDRKISEKAVSPVEWTVREFFLVRSVLGEASHRVVARWPLAG